MKKQEFKGPQYICFDCDEDYETHGIGWLEYLSCKLKRHRTEVICIFCNKPQGLSRRMKT